IMPRTAGVSSSVRRRFILFSPSPTSVWRWSSGRRSGLPICSTVIVLPLLFLSAIDWLLHSKRQGASPLRVQSIFGGCRHTGQITAAGLQGRVLDAAARCDVLGMNRLL